MPIEALLILASAIAITIGAFGVGYQRGRESFARDIVSGWRIDKLSAGHWRRVAEAEEAAHGD